MSQYTQVMLIASCLLTWIFTATWRPSCRQPLCTWPIEAAANGFRSNSENLFFQSLPNCSDITRYNAQIKNHVFQNNFFQSWYLFSNYKPIWKMNDYNCFILWSTLLSSLQMLCICISNYSSQLPSSVFKPQIHRQLLDITLCLSEVHFYRFHAEF